ncbi:MAG: hypothetical protein JJV96_00105 [Alphaproteobacteria bacterium]|nr:hypothetical protein [Alphaproteobacteria bacterium]
MNNKYNIFRLFTPLKNYWNKIDGVQKAKIFTASFTIILITSILIKLFSIIFITDSKQNKFYNIYKENGFPVKTFCVSSTTHEVWIKNTTIRNGDKWEFFVNNPSKIKVNNKAVNIENNLVWTISNVEFTRDSGFSLYKVSLIIDDTDKQKKQNKDPKTAVLIEDEYNDWYPISYHTLTLQDAIIVDSTLVYQDNDTEEFFVLKSTGSSFVKQNVSVDFLNEWAHIKKGLDDEDCIILAVPPWGIKKIRSIKNTDLKKIGSSND